MDEQTKRDKDDVIYTRSSKRVDVELGVSFEMADEGPHKFYTGITQDISQGGVFLATHRILPIGDKVRLTFSLSGREISAQAEVVWSCDSVTAATYTGPGMGLRFMSISEEDKRFIEEYVKQRETIYYDDGEL
ncbi:MAG TPA: TIGR02266 family protein [bacterium]|nr:TIGR02266 family protein [bacterium]HSA33082.1 TIGR02266 family protein [bacterium]